MTLRGTRRPSVVPITAPSFPTPPQPHVYRKIAYTFAAFTLVIVLVVIWLSSVRAEIVVKTKKTPVRLDTTVEIAQQPSSGQLPGRIMSGIFDSSVKEFQVPETAANDTASPGSSSSAATMIQVGTEKNTAAETGIAKGTVRIINNYSRPQTLVKTTRLLTTDNKLYRIDKTIVVQPGGQVTVGAYADKPGTIFAIGPTKFTIPGLFVDLQKFIYAESDALFAIQEGAGAVSSTDALPPVVISGKKVVTQVMLDEADRTLQALAFESAKKTLGTEMIDPKYGQPVYVMRVTERHFNVKPGQTADRFLGSLKLEVTAVYYAQDDMMAFIRGKLMEKIPEGREFLPFNNQTVDLKIEMSDAMANKATLRVVANAEYRITTTMPALQKTAVAGRKKDEVILSLKSMEGVEDVHVTLRPSWGMSKIPSLKDHIDVRVE